MKKRVRRVTLNLGEIVEFTVSPVSHYKSRIKFRGALKTVIQNTEGDLRFLEAVIVSTGQVNVVKS